MTSSDSTLRETWPSNSGFIPATESESSDADSGDETGANESRDRRTEAGANAASDADGNAKPERTTSGREQPHRRSVEPATTDRSGRDSLLVGVEMTLVLGAVGLAVALNTIRLSSGALAVPEPFARVAGALTAAYCIAYVASSLEGIRERSRGRAETRSETDGRR